tara:strand:+ start:181 stop:321 length:141 start_codon:yes stop_codon:yes gene_type:complete
MQHTYIKFRLSLHGALSAGIVITIIEKEMGKNKKKDVAKEYIYFRE